LAHSWATVCKTVHPMLSDHCLSVCPVCDVGVLHGQTVGWIKMKRGMQVGLGPGHILLDGDPAPLPQRDRAPKFSAHICCGQMAGWIKMPLGRQVGLGPSDIVLDGDPGPPQRGTAAPLFSAHIYCGHGRPCQLLLSCCIFNFASVITASKDGVNILPFISYIICAMSILFLTSSKSSCLVYLRCSSVWLQLLPSLLNALYNHVILTEHVLCVYCR